jgi:ammonium transporter, Amt family
LLSPTNDRAVIGMGMVDYSGSAVIHFTGGITALYAAYILGARRGRFYDREGRPLAKPGLTKGHSIALQMLGTMILWFCWYGFNSGSALLLPTLAKGSVASRAAVNTTIGAAAGALSALLVNGIIVERQTGEFVLDIVMCMNGWYVVQFICIVWLRITMSLSCFRSHCTLVNVAVCRDWSPLRLDAESWTIGPL